ncbi:hypothetical protein DSM106972_042820 [Dulcicalothrix desertica PCC 7102]|uniref:Putative restriction endonuclease domain-containing protein n=1 Tax=Dulcicalothrix desertica PCC 7102 TaxID=232991 RepID=A0A3S1AML1_9CYAN|nr:Uma2 family endonuclease [Dulcicalothrix desertica]RUT04713.1 hypothetical protein DSM106972_042820 [Dulcicalothrix desertica PCC 7102]TWH42721.1 Uma2 family endonuclease [Dulcicalothrix desertica PCC 7102]
MIVQANKKEYYTLDEYLELEINSQERHEYIDGEIILMTGGTPNHNRIALNFSAALNLAVKQQSYETFVSDQKLWIPKKRINTYPDVMVVEGEIELQEGRRDTITNPLIIAEVLSESTRAYDKDQKFAAYRTIPCFKEYILIDQYSVHVEQYYKTNSKTWTFTEYDDLNQTLSLNSMPFQIMLADIYSKVKFE